MFSLKMELLMSPFIETNLDGGCVLGDFYPSTSPKLSHNT